MDHIGVPYQRGEIAEVAALQPGRHGLQQLVRPAVGHPSARSPSCGKVVLGKLTFQVRHECFVGHANGDLIRAVLSAERQ